MEIKLDPTKFNISTHFLIPLIFQSNSMPILLSAGLVNAYIGDYGYRCKYNNCVLLLFNIQNRYYPALEERMAGFQAFHDWYDVNGHLRMFVFKIGVAYKKDFNNLIHDVNTKYSEEFKKVTKLQDNFKIPMDFSKEIYRYNL